MSEQMPITPAVLTWARERAGLSLSEMTDKYKNFAAWEQGNASPTYSQLESLADAFKIPVAVFFFPKPPIVPPIGETFRTLPKSEFEKLPSRIKMLLRKAKSLQLNLAELTQEKNPAPRLITKDLKFSASETIESLALKVREYLNISVAVQKTWPDVDTALKEWRTALHRVGVFVFKDAFRDDDFSGFCLFDDEFPIIYVNNSSTKTRQIFTYFHELAHLLFHTSGIDFVNNELLIPKLVDEAKQVEILCNKFASEFLLPSKEFDEVSAGHNADAANATLLASLFKVSREVVFRRFLDQGRITSQQYSTAASYWNEQRGDQGGSGGDYYRTKLSYLGRDYVSLALKQFHQNRIDEYQLADYLDTKPKNVGTLEEYFERGS